MSSLFRLTLKNIADKKVRFFLTTLSVLLGVMFTAGVFIFTDSMRSVFSDLSEDIAGRIDFSVRSQQDFGEQSDAAPVDPALASVIESVDGVQAVSPGITESDVFVQGSRGRPLRGSYNIGVSWVENDNMSDAFIADGRPPRGGDEFVMNATPVSDEGLAVGETYTLHLPEGTGRFELVGTFNFADRNEDRSAGGNIIAFDAATAMEVLRGGSGWDQIDVDVASDADMSAVGPDIQKAVAAACASGEAACIGDIEIITHQGNQRTEEDASDSEMNTFRTFLLVFAGIILAVSVFVIFNTFTIVLGQRIREFGLMRALGTTGSQITGTVIGEAAVVGLVSSALGFGAGIGLAYLLRWILEATDADLTLDTIVISPRTVLVAFLVGTGVTLVSALIPALRTRRIPPMAALRDDAGITDKQIPKRLALGTAISGAGLIAAVIALSIVTNWIAMAVLSFISAILLNTGGKRIYPTAGRWATLGLGIAFMLGARFGDYNTGEQWTALGIGCAFIVIAVNLLSPLFTPALTRTIGWPIRLVSGITGKLSSENAARSPRRTTTTAAALMIGLTLVATVSVAAQSLKTTWSDALDDAVKADWFICTEECINDAQASTFSSQLARDLEELPEIESAVSYRSAAEGLAITNDDGESVRYPVFAAEFAQLEQHLDLDIAEGSIKEARPTDAAVHENIAEDENFTLGQQITATFSTGQNAAFRIVAIYSENIIAGTSWLIDLPTWEQHLTPYSNIYASAITAPGFSQREIEFAIDQAASNYPQATINTKQGLFSEGYDVFNDDFDAYQVSFINRVVTIVNIFLSLSLVIAFIGIANTIALSVIERTRELGLLRAVGMTRRQTRRMVLGEGVIISVFGTILGTALGVLFGATIVSILPNDFISILAIPWRTLAIYLIIATAAGILSSFFPARRASRLNVLDAISNE